LGKERLLESFLVKVIPVADAEAVHDASVDQVEGVVSVRPGGVRAVVDLELW
jgi:hypothetical protein